MKMFHCSMDYRGFRKRIWLKRLIIGAPAAVVGVALAVGSNLVFSPEPTKPISKTVSETKQSASTANWEMILQSLDQMRAQAIMQRDVSQLESVYTGDSPLKQNDKEIIQDLIKKDQYIEGLHFQIENLNLLSHRWSNLEEVVEFEVTDLRGEYFVTVGNEKSLVEARASQQWLIALQKMGDSWLILNATAVK